MKVGYVFDHGNIIGGGELSLIDLADGIRRCGVEPVAFVPGGGEVTPRLARLGIPVVETTWPAIRVRKLLGLKTAQKRLAARFEEESLDLVHVNGARCMLYAGPAAGICGIPAVWHVRVLDRDRLLDRFRARYATAIVANSKAVAATLKPVIGRKQRVDVVYNGFRTDEIAASKPLDLKRGFGLSAAPVVLGVGRFSKWKGFDDLVRAFGILTERTKAALLLVGKSMDDELDCEKALRKQAGTLGNIVFAGWRNDVASIMKSASVLVLPSHGEPFGRVIVEAWAAGLPVVATNRGGPAEVVRHGVDGLLVEDGVPEAIADAVESVLHDGSLRKKLVSEGLKRATEFDLASHAKRIYEVYSRVLR